MIRGVWTADHGGQKNSNRGSNYALAQLEVLFESTGIAGIAGIEKIQTEVLTLTLAQLELLFEFLVSQRRR